MNLFPVITAAKDIVLALAAAVTASVAVVGLSRWQREMTGKAQFDTARKFAQSTYKVREEFRNCRVPLVVANEFPAGYYNVSSAGSNKEEAEAWAYVFKNRWKPLLEALQEFDSSALEAEALWGDDIHTGAERLRVCLRKLRGAADAIIDDHLSGGRDFQGNRDFGIEMRRTAFAPATDEKNLLTIELNLAIKAIEEKIRPHLNRG